MKFLDRLISFIFDLLVLTVAVVILLVTLNIIDYAVVDEIIKQSLLSAEYKVITITSAIIVILAFLKITIFSSTLSEGTKKNILVDTGHGKIQISQETIEGIVKNVVINYPQIKDAQARMAKAKKGINVYTVVGVYPNTNIKDVITRAQEDIKVSIESTTGVSVKFVDVRIRNVASITNVKVNEKINTEANINNNQVATEIQANQSETTNLNVEETAYVSKSASEEYLRDEANVLYKVKPNPEANDRN